MAAATFAFAWLLAPPLAAILISVLVIIGVLLDVHRFPAAAGTNREELEFLLDESEQALALLDRDGRVDQASGAFGRFFGRERAEVTGRTLAELSPDTGLERVLSEAATGTRHVVQRTLRNAAGARVPVDVTVRKSGAGSCLLVLNPTVPVAPLADVPKGDASTQAAALVATVERAAHDLNNILSAIGGNLDLARQDVGPVHPARESLDEILSATRRARGVASALMQASPRRARAIPSDAAAVPHAPAAPAVAAEPANRADPKAPASSKAGKLVLYVDDDEPLTDIVGRLLARSGHRVAGHTDARRALADFRSRAADFALVVTDLNLPNSSGLDVVREVRAVRPDVPVVLVSGFFRADEVDAARAAGIGDTLLKASSAHEFAADIVRYLTR